MYQSIGSPNPPKQAADLGGKDVGQGLLMEGAWCGVITAIAHERYVTTVAVQVSDDCGDELVYRLPHAAGVQAGEE